jgi:ankyrin repeat protein
MSTAVPDEFTANEQAEIDKFCAEYGCDVNAVDSSGLTLLHRAVESHNLAIVKFIVFRGADVNQQNADGWTPIYYAINTENIDIIKFLVKRVDVNFRNKCGCTPFHWVVNTGNIEIAKIFIAAKAKIYASCDKYGVPLSLAKRLKNAAMEKYLIEEILRFDPKWTENQEMIQSQSDVATTDYPRHN